MSFSVDFSGRVVLVTGGAAGIGAASAQAFAAAGATVVIADVDAVQGGRTVDEIVARGGAARLAVVDVAAEEAVDRLVAGVVAAEARLDVVHANAGIESPHRATEVSVAEWDRVLGVNLTGVFLVCRAALRQMYRQGSGTVVVTSSPHAVVTVPDTAAYAASKGGVSALTRSLALEAAPHGVRVNAVLPGTIDTPMVRREAAATADPAGVLRGWGEVQPLGRLGRPVEVANAVLFLASDAASFVTGAALAVDGGLMAVLPTAPGPA